MDVGVSWDARAGDGAEQEASQTSIPWITFDAVWDGNIYVVDNQCGGGCEKKKDGVSYELTQSIVSDRYVVPIDSVSSRSLLVGLVHLVLLVFLWDPLGVLGILWDFQDLFTDTLRCSGTF